MSCDNSVPVTQIIEQVRTALDQDYIKVNNPAITNGVLTTPVISSPSIRGDVIFDSTARAALRFAVGVDADTKPVVVGDKTDGTALDSLLAALSATGIIIDSTT